MAGRALRTLALAYKDLTGDLANYDGTTAHPADAIAMDVGILPEDFDADSSWTGSEFFKKTEEDQLKTLMKGNGGLVFSRTEPTHKQQLVKLLKSQGCVVAMT